MNQPYVLYSIRHARRTLPGRSDEFYEDLGSLMADGTPCVVTYDGSGHYTAIKALNNGLQDRPMKTYWVLKDKSDKTYSTDNGPHGGDPWDSDRSEATRFTSKKDAAACKKEHRLSFATIVKVTRQPNMGEIWWDALQDEVPYADLNAAAQAECKREAIKAIQAGAKR